MAGGDPGMVIRVAADLTDLESDLAEISSAIADVGGDLASAAASFDGDVIQAEAATAESALDSVGAAAAGLETDQEGVTAAVDAGAAAYGNLEASAVPAMDHVAGETQKAGEATGGLTSGMIAAASAVGTFAANAAQAGLEKVVGWIKDLAGATYDLVVQGSDFADVAGSFDTLAASAGMLGDELLTRVRQGTQGTITDLDLMSTLSRDLGVGLNLTTQQFGTLADGAFALAQTGRIDVKGAFDLMNDAMVNGRTRALDLQGVHVDLAAAEAQYAEAHRIYGRELDKNEKLEAARVGILDAIAASTKRLGDQTAGLDEMVDQVSVAWANFKGHVGAAVAESGVLTAGLSTLKEALVRAFGGDTDAIIKNTATAINRIAIAAVDAGIVLVEWAGSAVRLFGMVKVPIDALTVAINYVVTGFLDAVGAMAGAASHLPFVGDEWADVSTRVKAYADSWREVRDRTVEQMHADDALTRGQGAMFDGLNAIKGVLVDTKAAMVEASLATHNATQAATDHAAAQTTSATATAEAARAQRQLAADMAKFDQYQAEHTKWGPEMLLHLGNFEKKVQDVGIATQADMDKWAEWEAAHTKWGPEILTKLGTYTNKLTDTTIATRQLADGTEALDSGLKFTAETIGDTTDALTRAEAATLSWSDAMDQVRQGKGTMTGTIGKATKPAGMSEMEFQQMQTDPRTWEIMHGWDWSMPGGTGATWAWLDQMAPRGGGSTITQNVNVSTVMGDKNEIARVVKDALATDWRTSGTRA